MHDRSSIPSPSRLTRHTRRRPAFAETFERSDAVTIAAMDREGDDIPKQVPATPILLQRIGIVRDAVPVMLVDPFGGDAHVQLSCAIEAHLSLDPQRRGIHISRLGDRLARLSGDVFDSLEGYALTL